MPRWPHHPGVQRGGRCLPRCLQSGDPAAAPGQLFGSSNPSPIPPCWAQALAGLRALLLGTVTLWVKHPAWVQPNLKVRPRDL